MHKQTKHIAHIVNPCLNLDLVWFISNFHLCSIHKEQFSVSVVCASIFSYQHTQAYTWVSHSKGIMICNFKFAPFYFLRRIIIIKNLIFISPSSVCNLFPPWGQSPLISVESMVILINQYEIHPLLDPGIWPYFLFLHLTKKKNIFLYAMNKLRKRITKQQRKKPNHHLKHLFQWSIM